MSKNLSASPKTVEGIFAEFHQLASSEQPLHLGTSRRNQFLKSIFNKALEGGKAETLYEKIQEEGNWNLFQKVRKLDSKTLANFIRNEHPQTIAVVLAHLDSGQTAAIIEEFPPPLQTEVLYRIAQLEKIHPDILEEIDQTIQKEISQLESLEGGKMGGVRSVAEILNQMDSSMEGPILQGMEEQKQGMADEIRRLMFVFEDLIQVDDRSMMALLKEINNEQSETGPKNFFGGVKGENLPEHVRKGRRDAKGRSGGDGSRAIERRGGSPADHHQNRQEAGRRGEIGLVRQRKGGSLCLRKGLCHPGLRKTFPRSFLQRRILLRLPISGSSGLRFNPSPGLSWRIKR